MTRVLTEKPLSFKIEDFLAALAARNDDLPNTRYEPQAQLVLDVPAQNLPKNIKGLVWVLQVKNFEMMDTFRPIAEALAKEFKANIIMSPSQINDPDPKHLESRPVDKRFPRGPQFQPIVIRFVK